MDLYLDEYKAKVRLSLQSAAQQSQTIFGEAYRLKVLWKGDEESIEKVVVKDGYIFYQLRKETAILKLIKECGYITPCQFYGPLFSTTTLSYRRPQYLTLGETVIKTEKQYKDFTVAEHFTKKIFFFVSDTTYDRYQNLTIPDYSLYAADIGKGVKEVVAEKVRILGNTKLSALTVDQLTGDVILATQSPTTIQSLYKIPYLSEMLAFVGVCSSKEES